MLLGYNHNITYKGSVFHIQTEDSGIKNPHIITLLYREGVILCSKKTSYADILKIENLEAVVEDLMKEQHKDMLRRLKSGEFDTRAFGAIQATAAVSNEERAVTSNQLTEPAVLIEEVNDVNLLFQEEVAQVKTTSETPQNNSTKPVKQNAVSLDDAILSFFGASK
jgi:ketol-acid reductoisomerase